MRFSLNRFKALTFLRLLKLLFWKLGCSSYSLFPNLFSFLEFSKLCCWYEFWICATFSKYNLVFVVVCWNVNCQPLNNEMFISSQLMMTFGNCAFCHLKLNCCCWKLFCLNWLLFWKECFWKWLNGVEFGKYVIIWFGEKLCEFKLILLNVLYRVI